MNRTGHVLALHVPAVAHELPIELGSVLVPTRQILVRVRDGKISRVVTVRGIDLDLNVRAFVRHEVRAILPVVGIALLHALEFLELPSRSKLTDFVHLS